MQEIQEWENVMKQAICTDCKGIAYIGGAEKYQCMFNADVVKTMSPVEWQKVVEERKEIECDKYDLAPRGIRVKMRDLIEVGISTVFGGGSTQIPAEIRKDWGIKDGDKILWIRRGTRDYTFRKVGYKPPFKPQYR